MKQASGHEIKGKESWVYLLLKALYGCKQSANAWQQHLKKLLVEIGMAPLVSDPAVYIMREGDAYVIIGTHVDDLFVVHNRAGSKLKEKIWKHLSSKLSIKTLGEARWTLQMLIQRDAVAGVLKLSQENFVEEVLRRFGVDNCKSVPTPAIDAGAEAVMDEADLPVTAKQLDEIKELPFLELIGCCWWLAQMTRLDIFVAVQRASQWVARPSMKLWRWLIRILKYLSGTKEWGLVYTRETTAPPLEAYFDASFADCPQMRSTAGWVYLVHGAVVGYNSHTIKRVVTSSTEAECAALTILGKENTWERRVYAELMGLKELAPTMVHGDNTASLSLLETGVTLTSIGSRPKT